MAQISTALKAQASTAVMARTITFIDDIHEPLHDVYVWITGSFVVTAEDESDSMETWYNISLIAMMEIVTTETATEKIIYHGTVLPTESKKNYKGRIG